ncbi:glucuronokinase with putative uridyl pyrophosphorylase isoform X5 [Phycodurus eques]|uniref:glucuronokinase with putative uridyl pyrophosphorylase isoform X5 n=1 Tax=Phycodurus eques TaxID=693459 RepID=UPI002ACEB18A|nr:glucuronokinase with putative uridyl pyrophosphorylase isoform X5 [Phycodurus eques]
MICILLVAGHGTLLEAEIKQNDGTDLYRHLIGVPVTLLPGIGGKKILDFWWKTVNVFVFSDLRRQLFTEAYLVTNADKYKHFERWATANDFPVENIINNGSTTVEDCLGDVADLELAIRCRKLQDDIMVIAGNMLCEDQNFDLAQVIRFFRSKPGELIIYYEMEEGGISTSRGIVEVCPDSHRITRFLEKPWEGLTSSCLTSVVFYCIRKETLPFLSDHLSQTETTDRSFGRFWERVINQNQLDVFGMKLPTGFQLIGQVGLSDYMKWLTRFSTKQQDNSTRPITFRSFARVGLMGNPSDGFNGKTIAMTIKNFWAEVTLVKSQTLVLLPHPLNDPTEFGSLQDLFSISRKEGYLGGLRLLQATCKKFYQFCCKHGIALTKKNFTLKYDTNIPRQVGLAGSSAIVSAALKCLMTFFHLTDNVRRSGEPLVIEVMETFAQLTDQARVALKDRDWNHLAQLMDQNFELRRSVYSDECLGPGNLMMVALAKQFGSAVKLPGSGGSVVGLCLNPGKLVEMRQAFQEAGCVFCVITPYNPSASTVIS